MTPSSGDPDPLAMLQAGEPGPFEDLVRSQTPRLVAYFMRQGFPLQGAEDLTQDVFLKLYKSAPRYRPTDRFQAYLMRVARNALVDARRRGSRRESPSSLAEDDVAARMPAPGIHPPEAAAAMEEAERLHMEIAALPPAQREVFELAGLHGLSYPEVSDLLGIPVGTVKSRMHYAARRLKAAFAPDLDSAPGGEDQESAP